MVILLGDSLKYFYTKEGNMKQELKDDLKSYEGILDEKIEKLLNSLDIELEQTIMALRKLKIV